MPNIVKSSLNPNFIFCLRCEQNYEYECKVHTLVGCCIECGVEYTLTDYMKCPVDYHHTIKMISPKYARSSIHEEYEKTITNWICSDECNNRRINIWLSKFRNTYYKYKQIFFSYIYGKYVRA